MFGRIMLGFPGLLSLLCASPALARTPRPPPPAALPQPPAAVLADEITDRAYELQKRGLRNEAIGLLEKALLTDPLPKRHRNLAIPLEQAGRLAEALREYWAFQRDQGGEPPERQADVAERVAGLLQRLGLVVLVPLPAEDVPVVAHVLDAGGDRPRCVVRGAAPVGEPTPSGWGGPVYYCQPGPVTVELSLNGQAVSSRRVEVAAGARVEVAFAVRAPVRVSANRGRPEVRVDGQPLPGVAPGQGSALPRTLSLLLGGHEISARDGKEVVRQRLVVREGEPARVELRFRPSRAWIGWVAGGVALAVAGAVVGGAVYASQQPGAPGGADITLPPL